MTATPTPASKPRRARWHLKLLLFGVGLVFAMICLEAGSRVLAYAGEQKRIADWAAVVENRTEQIKGRNVTLGDIIHPSPYRDVIYQQVPNLDVVYMGHRYTTNADGFRGPAVPKAKEPGVFRIVGLGDSVMSGHGVDDDEPFLRVMARQFDAAELPHRVEIVNTAMHGYNTTMEVAMLENIGLQWSPDLVIIDFVRNDYSLPNFISTESDFLRLDKSWFLDWVSQITAENDGGFAPLANAPAAKGGGFANDVQTAPPQYRHHVGHDGYRRAMQRLAELQQQHGFRVVVTMHRYDDPVVRATCEQHGFPFVRGEDVVKAYEREHAIEKYLGSELTVSDKDPHPSAIQHRLLGEFYARWLLDHDYLR